MTKTKITLKATAAAVSATIAALLIGPSATGQTDEEATPSVLSSSKVPAGPLPTATVTPLQTTPVPTATVKPLPSASPDGTQPQTTSTATPSATPTPDGTEPPRTTNTVTPAPTQTP